VNRRRETKGGGPSALMVILIAGGAVLLLVAAVVGWFFAVKVPQVVAQQERAQCAVRLRQLGALYQSDVLRRGGQPESGGVQYFLDILARGGAPADSPILVCPGDHDAVPAAPAGNDAAALGRVCSFAVRDFARYPITGDDEAIPWVAADAADHHDGGINVLFVDTSVKYLDRDALGLAAGEAILAGPGSSHPELKKLCVVPAE